MRRIILKYHIHLLVFMIPVFLFPANSAVSACPSLFLDGGVDELNSVTACKSCAISTYAFLDRAFFISEASYYRASTDSVLSSGSSGNTQSLISASMGSYLNGLFKKLKRILSGISKFF
jgi:hypothetical protein